MANEQLIRQFNFYIANQENLVPQYNGRTLLIHDECVVGNFDNKSDAYEFGMERFEPGSFLIINCSPGDKDYSVNYRTVNRFSRLAAI